ncbi:MAG: DUF3168 domain-containing protein [Shimia sp.]
MSYAAAGALQAAVYERLSTDADVTALVGSAIYDAPPSGALPPLYVSLGGEEATDASDLLEAGARHDFTVSVLTDQSGFAQAKEVAAAVCDALLGAPLALTRGTLVGLWFVKAKAARSGQNDIRRIDLNFRARVDAV